LVAALPAVFSSSNSNLRSKQAVNALLIDLRQARLEAVSKGRIISFTVNPKTASYKTSEQTGWTILPDGVKISLLPNSPEPQLEETPHLIYFPDGSTSGGTLIVNNDKYSWRFTIGLNGKIAFEK
ncbi:MAG: GspH/FimT family protein, partial [Pseudomonadales bacterium]|nr:GspH/FimT family protein [Pseudomonadales bacterium]